MKFLKIHAVSTLTPAPSHPPTVEARELGSRLSLDDVFLQKDELAHACQDELLKKMSEFGYGVCLASVGTSRAPCRPPRQHPAQPQQSSTPCF